jgi:hypothetical protein
VTNSKAYNNRNVKGYGGDACGLCVWGGELELVGNEIYNNGNYYNEADLAVWCPAGPVKIRNNYIHDCVHDCSYVSCGAGNKTSTPSIKQSFNNPAKDVYHVEGSGYYYYDLFDSSKDPWPEIEYSYNIFEGYGNKVESLSEYGRPHALFIGTDNIKVFNNVFADGELYPNLTDVNYDKVENAGVFIKGRTDIAQPMPIQVKNNIFFNNVNPDIVIISNNAGYYSVDNNLYSKEGEINWVLGRNKYKGLQLWQNDTKFDLRSLVGDPLFKVLAPEAAEDYRIQSTSPAVGKGADVGLKTDFFGDPVPAGAKPSIGVDEVK